MAKGNKSEKVTIVLSGMGMFLKEKGKLKEIVLKENRKGKRQKLTEEDLKRLEEKYNRIKGDIYVSNKRIPKKQRVKLQVFKDGEIINEYNLIVHSYQNPKEKNEYKRYIERGNQWIEEKAIFGLLKDKRLKENVEIRKKFYRLVDQKKKVIRVELKERKVYTDYKVINKQILKFMEDNENVH